MGNDSSLKHTNHMNRIVCQWVIPHDNKNYCMEMDMDYMDIWMLTISALFIEGKEDINLIFLGLDIINDAVLLFYI